MIKIFLIGFMGSGKSHNGKKISKALGVDFFDLDKVIEDSEGQTITEIFDKRGEAYFRSLEKKYLREFKNKTNFLLSTGGGTACFNDNMKWMNKHGDTIYLDASVNLLTERLLRKQANRPLLKDKTKAELRQLIKEKLKDRSSYYLLAKFRLYQRKGAGEVSERILKLDFTPK